MTTEPFEKGLGDRIQQELLFKHENRNMLADLLIKDYNWDELTANSVWAFGPAFTASNMLIDYTLEDEVDKTRLSQVRNSIVQGF